MPTNQEHVHLAWPLWSGLRVIPTHGNYGSLVDQELLQTVRKFHACKQEEGQSVSSYILKMKSYIDNLERLGHAMTKNLSVSLILVSLRKEYDANEKTLPLKEVTLALHAIKAPSFAPKSKESSNTQDGYPAEGRILPTYVVKFTVIREGIVLLSRRVMKRRSYLKELALQGLKGSRKLNPGALSLYVGDGHRAAVEAIREFHLCLPSGPVFNFFQLSIYAPSITRGIISVSLLYKDGFVNRFENDNSFSVSKNNLICFNAIPQDNIYEIVMSFSVTNNSSMFVVSNKRAKLNLDSALYVHLSSDTIKSDAVEKLQHDRLLNSIDIKSFEKCVACMSKKMARKPYLHQVERAKDLLGLIHTDVCGPFKIMSRQ
ncbi:hypothetical protein Tco_0956660 [Tanacetum coccineum]